MNERIKELYKQAMEQHVSNNMAWEELNPEKFAELIVKECINRIEGCAVGLDNDLFVKGYNKGVSKVSSQVKKHFGVE